MKKLLVLTVCFIFIGAIYSFAEPVKQNPWELGTEISHRTYKEPGVMEDKGMMYGLFGSYTYQNNYMLKAEGLFNFGQVDYSSVSSGTMDNIDDYMLEFRGLAGKDFTVSNGTYTPYIGIGYRYLNDDTSGMTSSTGSVGYERESNYIYSPIGVEIAAPLKNNWSFKTLLEYDIFWWGRQKSHLSDARLYSSTWGYYTFNDVENDQDKGYGIRGSVKFQKKGEKIDFVIEPFIRYWNIKKSDDVTDSTVSENGLWLITSTFTEPKNSSTEIGIKFAAKF